MAKLSDTRFRVGTLPGFPPPPHLVYLQLVVITPEFRQPAPLGLGRSRPRPDYDLGATLRIIRRLLGASAAQLQ